MASAARNRGYSVGVLDGFTYLFDDARLAECVDLLAPKTVGFSLHSFADYKHVANLSRLVGQRSPSCYQLAGGEHVTFTALETLRLNSYLGAVILSEGEQTLCDLLDAISSYDFPRPVPEAVVRASDGSILNGQLRSLISDLDSIPYPDKDVVELALSLNRPVALSILSGRGCTYRCTFCTANTYLRLGGGLVWRRRRPEAVVAELESLISRYYGQANVHSMIQFQDVIGASGSAVEWTKGFIAEMNRRSLKVPYFVHSRADAIIAHEALLPELVDTGLTSVEMGIKSGVPRILQLYNKRLSIDSVRKAVNLLQASNIR